MAPPPTSILRCWLCDRCFSLAMEIYINWLEWLQNELHLDFHHLMGFPLFNSCPGIYITCCSPSLFTVLVIHVAFYCLLLIDSGDNK